MKRSYIVPAVALVLLALGCEDVTNGGNAKVTPGKYAGIWNCTYTQTGTASPVTLVFDITMTHYGSQLSGRGKLQDGRNVNFSGTVRPGIDFSGVLITAAFSFTNYDIPSYTYDVNGRFTNDRTASGTANGRRGTGAGNFRFTMTKK